MAYYRNLHKGQRCVIVGNGPSLNEMDLDLLRDEFTIGMNKIFLGFDRWNWRPTYHVAVNPLVLQQAADRIEQLGIPSFVSINGYESFAHPERMVFLKSLPKPTDFSRDPRIGVWEGHTVTYVAMQLAWFMGFREVALIGVDHNFAVKGPANQEVTADRPDASHFDPNYFGPGTKWNLPDLEASEEAYRIAKQAYEQDGRRIVNATVGGKLEIFPRMEYREWLRNDSQAQSNDHTAVQRALDLNRRGEKLFEQGDLDGAKTMYDSALQIRDDIAMIHNNLGVIAFSRGDTEQAFHHLRDAAGLDSLDRNILLNLLQVLEDRGETEQAELVVEQFAQIFPDDPEIRRNPVHS
ncbi:DUF115 domain-containing protein [bacterium]|nr:DUF115 domain-containing protein [bacterium]